jgi:Na+/melibiose symporter-like transporter
MSNNKLFMVLFGATCVLGGIKNILDGTYIYYLGTPSPPDTFLLALGIFILLFYTWDWLKNKKRHRRKT